MIFHSTNGVVKGLTLAQAVSNGLASDGGLFMPDRFPALPQALFRNISEMSLREIAYVVGNMIFGDSLSSATIKRIVDESFSFDVPLVSVGDSGNFVLELFHGPTLSFKDIGARFMARLLPELLPGERKRTILLATSGDSGGAIADSFRDMPGTRVVVLFPRGELSREQTAMFCGIPNVVPVEVGGTFDDCQALVKTALTDRELNAAIPLTSGNSINLARELPAVICYFHAYARAMEQRPETKVVMSIPCGNLGNLTAALMAKKMGLPIEKFIGADNANDTFVEYLQTGDIRPRRALVTFARAMDVGNPSNLARIIDLYGSPEALRRDVEGVSFTDREIVSTIRSVYQQYGYLFGPQSAAAYRALLERTEPGTTGIAIATGHPAKFPEAILEAIGKTAPWPEGMDSLRWSNIHTLKIPPTMNALERVLRESKPIRN